MPKEELFGGIECGGTKFICAIGTADGSIRLRSRIPTTGPEDTLDKVAAFFSEYVENHLLSAIGIGAFGPVSLQRSNPSFGTILNSPKLEWQGTNLSEQMALRLDVPTYVTTDVNTALIGESTLGAARGCSNAAYITVGTGIGAGLLVFGRVVENSGHPEVGHILIPKHPSDSYAGDCPYHADHCAEGLASGPAIAQRWGRSANELSETHPAWELEAYYIGEILINLIALLNPERLILGGGVGSLDHLLPKVRDQVLKLGAGYFPNIQSKSDVKRLIVNPELGDDAGIIGALKFAQIRAASEFSDIDFSTATPRELARRRD